MHSNRSGTPTIIKKSVKFRLGPRKFDPSISTKGIHRLDLKRRRQDDAGFVHGLSGLSASVVKRLKTDFLGNSSVKVLQGHIPRGSKNSNLRKTQGKLIGISKNQQLRAGTSRVSSMNVGSGSKLASVIKLVMKSASTPIIEGQKKKDVISKNQQLSAGTSGVSSMKVGSGTELASVTKPVTKSASTPSTEEHKKKDVVMSPVASFLKNLGLSKYVITFQAEEVDMLALKLMNDNDLKEMGLPMGPRKKILLGLAPTKARK